MIRRALKPSDLVLYTVAMTLSVRWVATTAGAGPVAAAIWLLAMLGFMAPLVLVTAELTGRFPTAGGVYAWTREAFGPFAGFVCGWLYWTCNLPFFSGLLVFIVAALGQAIGGPARALLAGTPGFLAASLVLALAVAAAHLRGLGWGKQLSNLGAAGAVVLTMFVIGAGAVLALTRGPATDFAHASWSLPLNADAAVLWSTMVFAFGGPEALAFLKDDVEGGVRSILKALAVVGAMLVGVYSLATLGLLAILKPGEVSHLAGLPDALQAASTRLGAPALGPVLVGVLAVALLGGYAAWFGLAAKLPFAAGVDRVLPAAFARLDPKTGAPVTALMVQVVLVAALVLLSVAGANLKAAYDFLVAMTVLSYTLPFLFLFAAYLKLGPAPAGVGWRVPGGPATRRVVGLVGLVVTASAILCTLVPSADATDKAGAVAKLVLSSAALVLAGVGAYALAAVRARRLAR